MLNGGLFDAIDLELRLPNLEVGRQAASLRICTSTQAILRVLTTTLQPTPQRIDNQQDRILSSTSKQINCALITAIIVRF